MESTLPAGGDKETPTAFTVSTHLFSLVAGTDATTVSGGATTMAAETEKPYDDFTEVKVAIMIDRIYIPLIVCFGVVGNVLCFITLVFSSLRSTSTCVYMAAIAVLDCVILVLDVCVLIRGFMGHTAFYFSNDWACGFHNFLFYFSIHFDVLLLLAVTVDRYIVIKFPLRAQSLSTPRSALRVITGVGLFSFGLNFQIFFTRRMGPSGNPKDPLKCWYPDPNVDFFMKKIYTWVDASIYSFIPTLALLVLNVLIIRQLKASRKFSKQFTERRGGKGDSASKGGGTASVRVEVECDTVSNGMCTSVTDLDRDDISTDIRGSCESVHNGSETTAATTTASNGNVYIISGEKGKNGRAKVANDKLSKAASVKKSSSSSNITVMLLLVSFAFLVLTSPVVIVLLYKRYYWLPSTNAEKARARLTHAFVDNLMYTNHAINFVLYCVSGQRFRQELKRLLSGLCCRR